MRNGLRFRSEEDASQRDVIRVTSVHVDVVEQHFQREDGLRGDVVEADGQLAAAVGTLRADERSLETRSEEGVGVGVGGGGKKGGQ